jgi:hypothetical protein
MAFNQYTNPRDNFGEDLIKVFGPKASRKHISKFTAVQIDEIIDSVPEYVDTDDLGPRPSFFQIVNKILLILQRSGTLNGIDLNWCTTLSNRAMRRHPDHYFHISKLHKNNSVQRGIKLRHLLRDILFPFNPDNVLMGLARYLKDGTLNVNNAQHRTVACIIIGITEIPFEGIASELESGDVDLYATDNLHTLSASPFDEFRIQVRRNVIRKAEGRTDLIDTDIKCEDIFNIHNRYGSRFVEKGGDVLAKEFTGVGNMLKYYDTYGADIYERAVSIICAVFSKAPMSGTGNVWGLMEFLREQENNGTLTDTMELDWSVQEALAYKYTDPKKSGMHLDIKGAFKDFMETSSRAKDFIDCPEPRIIAAGITKLCRISYPEINWPAINYKGASIENTLSGFKAPPRKRSALAVA